MNLIRDSDKSKRTSSKMMLSNPIDNPRKCPSSTLPNGTFLKELIKAGNYESLKSLITLSLILSLMAGK